MIENSLYGNVVRREMLKALEGVLAHILFKPQPSSISPCRRLCERLLKRWGIDS
jgi:hypothetical protein